VLALAGFLRGLAIYETGSWLGLVQPPDFWFRVLGGPAFVIVSYLLLNLISSGYLTSRALSGQLELESINLKEVRQNFQQNLENLAALQSSRIKDLLAPAIWELGKHLGDARLSKNAAVTINALREINDNGVRPLSHELGSMVREEYLAKEFPKAVRLGQFALPQRVYFGRMLPVGILAMVLFVIGLSSQVAQVALGKALINTLTVTFFILLEIGIIRFLTLRVSVPTWSGFFLSAIVGILAGASIEIIRMLPYLSLSETITGQSVIFFGLSIPTIFLLSTVQQQRESHFANLANTVEQMRLLSSKLRQQSWLNQRLLATELHGPLQATLYACAMRLAQKSNPSPEDFAKVERDVQMAVAGIGSLDYLEGQALGQLLEDMKELWSGTCEITFKIADQTKQLLDSNQAAARCVVEVAREAINNAIKHGSAKNIWIEISNENDLIHLTVRNDGVQASISGAGFGTQLIDQLTHHHKLDSRSGQTFFEAWIPHTN
jgi:signal transduction histidine kinase